jgi:hypothetical protein
LRVEELLLEEDINKAFRELQDLHRMWKGTLVLFPKSIVMRSGMNLGSDQEMHDKRELLFEKLRGTEKKI